MNNLLKFTKRTHTNFGIGILNAGFEDLKIHKYKSESDLVWQI